MLQFKVLESATLELLISINNSSLFENYRLVGGTALALIMGHRKSIDLDFFGSGAINPDELINFLKRFGGVELIATSKYIQSFFVNDIKVDIVEYNYPWIDELYKNENNIKLATPKEIAAMKIAAIINRGSKKDFVDMFYLLKVYTFSEIFNFYTEKYSSGSLFQALKSVVYFDDADQDDDPFIFHNITWEEIKVELSNSYFSYISTEGYS